MTDSRSFDVRELEFLTHDQARDLATDRGGLHVSIHLPTERAGRATRKNPIRLKNQLRTVEKQADQTGADGPELEKVIRPVTQLIDDAKFWQEQDDGLSLLLSKDRAEALKVPLRLPEQSTVGERFRVRPLLRMVGEPAVFYVLVLSQDKVRLLRGTRDRLVDCESHELPAGFEQAIGIDEAQRSLQFHTGAAPKGAAADRAAVFHGHGAAGDEAKTKRWLADYCRVIDRAVERLCSHQPRPPLVLACVETLAAMYRRCSRYPELVDTIVAGNPETLSQAELHHKAWPIVKPRFERDRLRAVSRFNDLAATPQTSDDPATILGAATEGRIDTLLVSTDQTLPGEFDPITRCLELGGADAGNDLLDAGVALTFENGGRVYGFEPDATPGRSPLAATFRY